MTQEEIINRLAPVMQNVLRGKVSEGAELTPETKLQDELGLDSLDMIDLILQAETTFNIKLDMADAKNVQTLRDLTAFIQQQL